ncbi:hypothetical protein VE02_01650 [Pseudogymnoascus sp. 03VT05]|nr:hypothetical protein VE02_01650 [Pseudogymnoascus sp. 03VT05]
MSSALMIVIPASRVKSHVCLDPGHIDAAYTRSVEVPLEEEGDDLAKIRGLFSHFIVLYVGNRGNLSKRWIVPRK